MDAQTKIGKLDLKTTVLIAILMAAAAVTGTNLTVNVNLEGRLAELETAINIPVNSSLSALQKEVSYIISKVGNYYCMQNGTTGKLDYYGTNATKTIRYACGNATDGTVLLRAGQYLIDDYILLHKNGSLIGEGVGSTILKATENMDFMIFINNTPTTGQYGWTIEDIEIEMNQYNGHAVYSNYSCTTSQRAGARIWNVLIDYVAAGYCGIFLYDVSRLDVRHVIIRTYGTGMKYMQTDEAFNWGDSYFGHLWIQLLGSNTCGINITATDFNNQAMNIVQFDECDIYMINSLTNTYGAYFYKTQYVQFNHYHCENAIYAVYMNDLRYSTWVHPTIYASSTGSYGFYIASSSRANTILGGHIRTVSYEVYDHSYVDGTLANKLCNVFQDTYFESTPQFDLLRNIAFYDCGGYNPKGQVSTSTCAYTESGLNFITDGSSGSAIANNTLYYIANSARTFYITGGSITSIQVDGATVWTSTGAMITLRPRQTVKFVWSSQPTIVMMCS